MRFGDDQKRWGPAMVEGLCRGPVAAIMRADSHARHALWELTGESPPHPAQSSLGLRPLNWEGSGSGTFTRVGCFDSDGENWQVNLDLMAQKIDGHWVVFAEFCTLAFDREMGEAFLDAAFPGVPRFKPSQLAAFCDRLSLPAPKGPQF